MTKRLTLRTPQKARTCKDTECVITKGKIVEIFDEFILA